MDNDFVDILYGHVEGKREKITVLSFSETIPSFDRKLYFPSRADVRQQVHSVIVKASILWLNHSICRRLFYCVLC